jgi:hypothetical protein
MASRSAIHWNIEFAGTVLAADPISVRVSHFKGVPSLGDVRSLAHSANLGAETAGGLTSAQSISAFPESPARFRGKVVIVDFDHNEVLEKAPPLVLNLVTKWPATKAVAPTNRRQVRYETLLC